MSPERDHEVEIEIADVATGADVAELRESLYAYNRTVTGYDDGRALSCFVRSDDGRLLAGLDGFTWGGYAYVDLLWISAELRGQGVGRRLVEAAEAEATRRGCATISLDTHEFQAPGFYEKLGYTVVGFTTDTPRGYRQFFLQKALVDGDA